MCTATATETVPSSPKMASNKTRCQFPKAMCTECEQIYRKLIRQGILTARQLDVLKKPRVLFFRPEVPDAQIPAHLLPFKFRLGKQQKHPACFWVKIPKVGGKVITPISVMTYVEEDAPMLKDLELLGGLNRTQDFMPEKEDAGLAQLTWIESAVAPEQGEYSLSLVYELFGKLQFGNTDVVALGGGKCKVKYGFYQISLKQLSLCEGWTSSKWQYK